MAVFTQIPPSTVLQLLQGYDPQAQLSRLEGISAGIENTNYFVTARLHGQTIEAVLTLFENLNTEQVEHFVEVINWWAARGFPVPEPLRDQTGRQLHQLAGKPTLLLPRLPGRHHMTPTVTDCAALGRLLGQMHCVAEQAPFHRPVTRDLSWMQSQRRRLQGLLPSASMARLDREILRYQQALDDLRQCPHGLVHGDLFRDNVLFASHKTQDVNQISGLIDFYHSGREVLLFDLAVAAIDWCRAPVVALQAGEDEAIKEGMGTENTAFAVRLDPVRLTALVDAYSQERPWQAQEARAWPSILRLAALRFWLARLISRYLPGYQQQAEAGDTIKDPTELEDLLIHLDELFP